VRLLGGERQAGTCGRQRRAGLLHGRRRAAPSTHAHGCERRRVRAGDEDGRARAGEQRRLPLTRTHGQGADGLQALDQEVEDPVARARQACEAARGRSSCRRGGSGSSAPTSMWEAEAARTGHVQPSPTRQPTAVELQARAAGLHKGGGSGTDNSFSKVTPSMAGSRGVPAAVDSAGVTPAVSVHTHVSSRVSSRGSVVSKMRRRAATEEDDVVAAAR
jgi:hypothetical protein